MIRSFDIPLSRLAEIGRRGGIRGFQQDALVLAWTPLLGFDSYVVNVFAPRGKALWNFNVYASLFDSELTYRSRFLVDESRSKTEKKINRIIREAGHPKQSDFSSLLLGGWTATPDYFPPREQSDVHFRSHRHHSLLVPEEARSRVNEHFTEQAATFLGSSVAPCDDTIALSEVEDLRGSNAWKVLAESVSQIGSQEELEKLLDVVAALDDESRFQEFVNALDLRYGMQGHISLWLPPASLMTRLNADGCVTLLKFRLRVALSVCSLPQIERLMNEADNSEPSWSSELHDRIRLALRDRVRPFLSLIAFKILQ